MATMSLEERQALLDELSGMKFGRAKGKLARMDAKGRLVYYRNVQQSGEWHTKYALESLGIAVTLVELNHAANDQARNKQNFEFANVLIEALDD